jgi:hypothetical protein
MYFTHSAHTSPRNSGSISPCFQRQTQPSASPVDPPSIVRPAHATGTHTERRMSRPGRYPAPHTPHRQARDARKRKRQKGRGSGADGHQVAPHPNPKPPPLSGRKSPPWMAQEGQGGLQPGRILLHYGGAGTFIVVFYDIYYYYVIHHHISAAIIYL